MQYRPEIDGLRTLAVIPVILFHCGLLGLTGGYVGVDIFFVISGYLITSIIIGDLEKNQFSIVNFYERRARRILPALSLVLAVTLVAATLLMPPSSFTSLSQSVVAAVTFSSNIFFYFDSGYFSTAADEKPLLHTWSLAVEEQYYLFFPLFVAWLWFLGRIKLSLLIILMSVASLVVSHVLLSKHEIDANFYLIFSRAWELFFGSLIALLNLSGAQQKKIFREFFGIFGLGLIVFSMAFFDKQTPFPSIYTLLPVVGTMLIIIFSDQKTVLGRLLASKIFVSTGLISYSLYLWHQPLFAFMRMKTIGEPSVYAFVLAIILIFGLSFLSYRYIEKPFRNKKQFSRKIIFACSSFSILCFLLIGMFGYLFEGFKGRYKENPYVATMEFSPKRDQCHTSGLNYLKPNRACKYFGGDISWASFGDSHTVEPAFALAKILEPKGQGILHLSFSGCPPALLFDVNLPGCSKWINESLAYLEKKQTVKNVLLGFRYSKFLHGDQQTSYPHIPNKQPMLFPNSAVANYGDAREIYWKSYLEILNRLLAAGKTVYVLYPIPELPVHIIKASTPFSVFGENTMIDMEKATSAEYYFARNEFILRKLDSLSYSEKLIAVKPFDILCKVGYCPAAISGKALYFDDSHLSIAGSSFLLSGSAIIDNL